MSAEWVRRCASCGTENAPQVMRCRCGALLAGLDLVQPQTAAAPAPAPAPARPSLNTTSDSIADANAATTTAAASNSSAAASAGSEKTPPLLCQFDDCAQPNPPGSPTCLYCNRPLPSAATSGQPPRTDAPSPALGSTAPASLLNLPSVLKSRYRLLEPLPTVGGEAELMLLEPLTGGEPVVAKIYRHGMAPKAAIHERLIGVDARYRVQILETGQADGHFYELMPYYRHGSWRSQMQHGALHEGALEALVRALAPALAAIHQANLLHRDLKPDNILITRLNPLQLVLTDFGSASVIDATLRFTGNARTLPYAAPESLSGVLDAKADYWAFGMIVLECALGRHPFADLSEAVIMHHLSTRSMDLSGVPMPAVRKLLRGLLLRDPKQRWGEAEVARWLAHDPNLVEPVDSGTSLFAQPYHLGLEICHTPQQLATSMARNWSLALQDLENGQLQAWFRDVQKDQNVVRLLLEWRFDRQLPADVRLLRLILHLAPGVVPIWRGSTLDVRSILSHAARALKGEPDSSNWLDQVHRLGVLRLYAASGDATLAELEQRWQQAAEQWLTAWDTVEKFVEQAPRSTADYANIDDMLYGTNGAGRPALADMHARLLAGLWDRNWVARLRQQVADSLRLISLDCPWLAAAGDPESFDPPTLMAWQRHLPQLRKAQQQAQQQREQQARQQEEQWRDMKAALQAGIEQLQSVQHRRWLTLADCARLRADLEQWLELLARLGSSGRTDAPWRQLERHAQQNRQISLRLLEQVDALSVQWVGNQGWLSQNALVFVALAAFVGGIWRGPALVLLIGLAALALVLWRLLPVLRFTREIGQLTRRLRRPSSADAA